jgi:hypothetical protein
MPFIPKHLAATPAAITRTNVAIPWRPGLPTYSLDLLDSRTKVSHSLTLMTRPTPNDLTTLVHEQQTPEDYARTNALMSASTHA